MRRICSRHLDNCCGNAECNRRLALLFGADADDTPLVVVNVTDADAVDAGVMHIEKGDGQVAAIESTSAATLKATVVSASTLNSSRTAMRFCVET